MKQLKSNKKNEKFDTNAWKQSLMLSEQQVQNYVSPCLIADYLNTYYNEIDI